MSTDRLAVAKARALDDLTGLIHALQLQGKARGRSFTGLSPFRQEKNPSFTLWLHGPAKGGWKDFGGGTKGDIVDLVALLAADGTRSGALKWLEHRYSLARIDASERQRLADAAATRRRTAEREIAETDEAARLRAIRLIKGAAELNGADPASLYMARRGCPLAGVPHLEPKTFRWIARHAWWMSETRPHPEFPALLSAMRDGGGRLMSVHRTFLARDGSGKAAVAKPKLIYPACGGATIRISQGPSALTCEEAAAEGVRGPMIYCEGVEDGATLAIDAPEYRVHAVGSLPGLLSAPDFPCADSYLIARDNDWGKPQAADMFDAAMRRLHAFGKPIAEITSPMGKDFNDIVRTA